MQHFVPPCANGSHISAIEPLSAAHAEMCSFVHREIVLCKMQPIRNWCKIAQKSSVNQNTYKTVEPVVANFTSCLDSNQLLPKRLVTTETAQISEIVKNQLLHIKLFLVV